jgi:cell filamentation protein
MPDPYVYPGSNVLKNKFNTIDQDILNQMERQKSTIRLAQIREHPIEGDFDLKHLQKIHEHIFKDVYEWAGNIRTVDIAKSTLFCPIRNLDDYQKSIFDSLKKEKYLVGLAIDQFSKKAAYYLGEVNMIHPFREGNGRSQREFMRELALHAGYELNLESPHISEKRMIEASIQSATINNDALEAIIRENIRPLELVTKEVLQKFVQATSINDLSKVPHSKELFAAYAKETLVKSNQEWTIGTNQEIAKHMLMDGISSQRTEAALKYSPHEIKNVYKLVKEIKEIPEIKKVLQKSKDLSR